MFTPNETEKGRYIMKKITSMYKLTENEQNLLLSEDINVKPEICVCNSFVAVLKKNGSVTIKDHEGEKEIEKNIICISGGRDHILCLGADKTVRAYGDNSYYQCDVSGWDSVIQIKAGFDISTAITTDGRILMTGKFAPGSEDIQKAEHLLQKNDSRHEEDIKKDDNELPELFWKLNSKYTANEHNGIAGYEYYCSVCGVVQKDVDSLKRCYICKAPRSKIEKRETRKANSNINLINGSVPVMVSAPYSVRYKRNEKTRQAHAYTGAIVEYLCQRYGAYGITRLFNNNDDPNSSMDISNYRKALENYIIANNCVCLLHIYCLDDENMDYFGISTNSGKNINPRYDFLDQLELHLFRIGDLTIDEDRSYGRNTICNYIHKKNNISCYRIDLSFSVIKKTSKLKKFVDELGAFIEESF